MYGIFTYIWLIFMVNVGKYTIHGSYGKELDQHDELFHHFVCSKLKPSSSQPCPKKSGSQEYANKNGWTPLQKLNQIDKCRQIWHPHIWKTSLPKYLKLIEKVLPIFPQTGGIDSKFQGMMSAGINSWPALNSKSSMGRSGNAGSTGASGGRNICWRGVAEGCGVDEFSLADNFPGKINIQRKPTTQPKKKQISFQKKNDFPVLTKLC